MDDVKNVQNFRVAAKAFIVDDGKLLLMKRSTDDVHKPGWWDIPGGRLETGESPFDGLRREAQEEAKLDIDIIAPLDVRHFTRDDGQKITMIIFLCKPHHKNISLSEAHTEHKWESLEDMDGVPEWLHNTVDKYNSFFAGKAWTRCEIKK